jgi:hypothetical protein
MSLIKKADVKNHLSTRHRTEIHLCQPEDELGTAGSGEEGSVGTAQEIRDSEDDHLNAATLSGTETSLTVTASDPSPAIDSARSKSAKN